MVLSGVPAALVLVTPGRFSLNRNQINIVLSVNHSGSDEADQSSDAWMAELLQNCEYEKQHRSSERLAGCTGESGCVSGSSGNCQRRVRGITRTGAAGMGSL